jgi:DNA-binding NtrC family response regulator
MESIPKKHTPILIVDDDEGLLMSIKAMLVSMGMPEPALISEARRVMPLLRECSFQLVLVDIIMPQINGMDLMKQIKEEFPFIECIIITAVDDLSSAVQAMRYGAYDYLVKPLEKRKLIISIRNALEKHDIRRAITLLQRAPGFSDIKNPEAFREMVAEDELMASVFCQAETFASSDYNLLITGETGTGKEMLARIVHRLSNRSDGAFIALNMGAFAKTLVEDDLFGHAKGAFTGAIDEKKGFFEEAQGGTIFFDEITEMDHEVQGKLLRVIQERELYRLGSTDVRRLDLRIISTTNRDIYNEVETGRFRKDLYYRLNVCHIDIPPLRKRRKDILPLARHFMDIHSRKNQKEIHSISQDLAECLMDYSFPGNVREIENIIAACVLNESTSTLTMASAGDLLTGFKRAGNLPEGILPIKEQEKQLIYRALKATKGNRTRAAEILGIGLRTLQRKLKGYDRETA